jgi:hypothetical protein
MKKALKKLLTTIPTQWEGVNADSLTAEEEKALFHLVAAGLVERRLSLKLQMFNDPVSFEATFLLPFKLTS